MQTRHFVSALTLALCGCATTHHDTLSRSADRLERSSLTLAEDSRAAPYQPGYSREARELADQAHDFRVTLDDPRADSRDVKNSFERVSHRYHDLRDDVDRTDSREAQQDLKPVTEAYLDVERGMGGYPESRHTSR